MIGYFLIKSKLNGFVVEIKEGKTEPATSIVANPVNGDGTPNQRWTVSKEGLIQSKLNGFVLDITGSNKEAGTPIIAYPVNGDGTPNQRWTVSKEGLIQSKLNGFVLDITGSNKEAGTPIIAHPVNGDGTPNQLWELVAVPDIVGQPQPQTQPQPQVVIANIIYDGFHQKNEKDEYIEIANQGNTPYDVSNWIIHAGDNHQNFRFPSGTVLQAGQTIRVYTNEVHPETGGFSFQSKRAIWNNKGDTAQLYDVKGNLVSSWSYGDAAQEQIMPSLEDIEKIKTKLGVTKLRVVVDFDRLKVQTRNGGKVTFLDALESAIRSFIEDGEDDQSPVGVIESDPETFDLPSDADRALVSEAIRGYINLPSSEIILLHSNSDSEFLPKQGESIEENWIFYLSLPDLCYNLFWAIVDRKGTKKTYNYGFG